MRWSKDAFRVVLIKATLYIIILMERIKVSCGFFRFTEKPLTKMQNNTNHAFSLKISSATALFFIKCVPHCCWSGMDSNKEVHNLFTILSISVWCEVKNVWLFNQRLYLVDSAHKQPTTKKWLQCSLLNKKKFP